MKIRNGALATNRNKINSVFHSVVFFQYFILTNENVFFFIVLVLVNYNNPATEPC